MPLLPLRHVYQKKQLNWHFTLAPMQCRTCFKNLFFPTLHHTHKTQSLDLAIPISLSMDATISNGLVATLMDCRSTHQGVYNGTYHSCIGLTLKIFNELHSVWEGWIEERAMSYTHLATDIPCGSGNNNSTCILALVTTLLRLITTIKFISS